MGLDEPTTDGFGRPRWPCTPGDVAKAYRKLSVLVHPDKNSGKDARKAFEALNETHLILKDPGRREKVISAAAAEVGEREQMKGWQEEPKRKADASQRSREVKDKERWNKQKEQELRNKELRSKERRDRELRDQQLMEIELKDKERRDRNLRDQEMWAKERRGRARDQNIELISYLMLGVLIVISLTAGSVMLKSLAQQQAYQDYVNKVIFWKTCEDNVQRDESEEDSIVQHITSIAKALTS
eukprot:gene10606-12276_t